MSQPQATTTTQQPQQPQQPGEAVKRRKSFEDKTTRGGDAASAVGGEGGKEKKERRAVTVQVKRPPAGGNIIGALIKEAETKGRNHLREVEEKRLSMIGNNEAIKSAFEAQSKPKPGPASPSPTPVPRAGSRIVVREPLKEANNKTPNDKQSEVPKINTPGEDTQDTPESSKEGKEENKEEVKGKEEGEEKEDEEGSQKEDRPARTNSFKGLQSLGVGKENPEEGKATFSKEEVQRYKEEMMKRYEEEEARQGRKKRHIPPGPGVGAPAPPPRKKPESSPVVPRKEKEEEADTPERRARLRQNVIDELLQTEADYIRDLKIIQSLYHNPLKSQAILEPLEFQSIFSNFNIILNVSQEVEAELTKMKESKSLLVGKTFLKVADYLKMYTQYCSNQEICITTIATQEKKNKLFAQFLDECALNPTSRGMSLNAFLIKPIQRICKYPLLLKELIKYTPEQDPDYNDLKAALEKVSAVVNVVNKKKAETENLQMLLEIQGQIAGGQELHLIEPGRIFLMEATFNKISGGKCQERHFFLFNDLLVYVSTAAFGTIKGGKGTLMTGQLLKGRKKYVLKGSVNFQKALVRDVEDDGAIRNAFDIIQLEGKKKVLTICCTTPEEKKTWITEIEEKIENFLQKEMVKRQEESAKSHIEATKNPIEVEKPQPVHGTIHAVSSPITGPKKIGRTRTRLPTQVLDAVPLDAAFEEMEKEVEEEKKSAAAVKRRPAGVATPNKSLPLPPTLAKSGPSDNNEESNNKPPSPQNSVILGVETESQLKPPSPHGSGIGGITKPSPPSPHGSGIGGFNRPSPPSPHGSGIAGGPNKLPSPQSSLVLSSRDSPNGAGSPQGSGIIRGKGTENNNVNTDSTLGEAARALQRTNSGDMRMSGGSIPPDPRVLQRSYSERVPGKFDSTGRPASMRKPAPSPPPLDTKPGRISLKLDAPLSLQPEQQPTTTDAPATTETPTVETQITEKKDEGTETPQTSVEPTTTNETVPDSPTEEEEQSPTTKEPTQPQQPQPTKQPQPSPVGGGGGVKPGPAGRTPPPAGAGRAAGRVSNYRKAGGGISQVDALLQNTNVPAQPQEDEQQPQQQQEGGGDPSQPGGAAAPAAGGRGYRSRISYYSPTAIMDESSGESTSSTRTTRTRPTRGRGRGN